MTRVLKRRENARKEILSESESKGKSDCELGLRRLTVVGDYPDALFVNWHVIPGCSRSGGAVGVERDSARTVPAGPVQGILFEMSRSRGSRGLNKFGPVQGVCEPALNQLKCWNCFNFQLIISCPRGTKRAHAPSLPRGSSGATMEAHSVQIVALQTPQHAIGGWERTRGEHAVNAI